MTRDQKIFDKKDKNEIISTNQKEFSCLPNCPKCQKKCKIQKASKRGEKKNMK